METGSTYSIVCVPDLKFLDIRKGLFYTHLYHGIYIPRCFDWLINNQSSIFRSDICVFCGVLGFLLVYLLLAKWVSPYYMYSLRRSHHSMISWMLRLDLLAMQWDGISWWVWEFWFLQRPVSWKFCFSSSNNNSGSPPFLQEGGGEGGPQPQTVTIPWSVEC